MTDLLRNAVRNPVRFCLPLMLFTTIGLFGQGKEIKSDYYSNYIPKRPEVGSLGTFGNTTINYYTGLPEVSLNLFQLQGRELALPVSIGYDATGIRTDELSGSVGIKWILAAGGFVQRELKGLADERTDNGYLKYARETNYFAGINGSDWAQWSEKNERDAMPDIFTIVIPGRTIRFVLDKNGVAHAIPRDNVNITYTTETYDGSQKRINKIDVVTENGTRYTFGGDPNAIELRTIETLVLSSTFYYKVLQDCPPYTAPIWDLPPAGTTHYYYGCNGTMHEAFVPAAILEEKKIPQYTSKWNLVSITLPSGEATTFKYRKLADVRYVTRPRATRISPVLEPGGFIKEVRWCKDILCTGYYYEKHFFNGTFATRRFGETDPGSKPEDGVLFPGDISFETNDILDITNYPPTPGAVSFYHTLITESNIALESITSATGNTATFKTSARADLPNAMKYDEIALRNMENRLIKSVKLNYKVVDANEDKDYFWFSEALLMREFKSLKVNSNEYYANYVKKHTEGDIPNKTLVKYVYEGLKDYNYKRTFLTSIEDVSSVKPLILYEFDYSDLQLLRRRTTPLHDQQGFHRSRSHETRFGFATGKNAMLTNSFAPDRDLTSFQAMLTGQLKQVRYPTGGMTHFHFATKNDLKLRLIEDIDHAGKVVRQREIEYVSTFPSGSPIFVSYQDFKIRDSEYWMKYKVSSSSAQNDSYSLTKGAVDGSAEVIVYHGTKDDNNGFERLLYSAAGELTYKDVSTTIFSNPAEKRKDGNPIRNIFPFPQHTERDHTRGLLLKHQIFKKGSTIEHPLRETTYNYVVNPYGYKPPVVKGLKGGSFNWTSKIKATFWSGYEQQGIKRYRWAIYDVPVDWVILESSEEVNYGDDRNKETRIVSQFTYDPQYLQLIETTSYSKAQSDRKFITKTKFATHRDYDYTRDDCTSKLDLCAKNCATSSRPGACKVSCQENYRACLATYGNAEAAALFELRRTRQHMTPVEIQEWTTEGTVQTLTGATVVTFGVSAPAESVLPRAVWARPGASSATPFVSSKINTEGKFIWEPAMIKVHSYDTYDPEFGRIVSQTSKDGTVNKYQWAYGGSLVAEHVRNPGTYEQRDVYKHIPLVGPISITDANGRNTTYNYDVFNRLLHVRDHDLNIVSGYAYHLRQEARTSSLSATISVSGDRLVNKTVGFSTPFEPGNDGSVVHQWDFGDEAKTETTATSVSHKYKAPGIYKVKLRKTHPLYGAAQAEYTLEIGNAFGVSLCVDGPYLIDIPPVHIQPIAGGCTTLPMDVNKTVIKAAVSGGCGSLTYQWELQTSSGAWQKYSTCGATCNPPSGFTSRVLGAYKVRCIVKDGCGNTATSNIIELTII